MALGLTQPLTEMSTRHISLEVKAVGAQGWQLCRIHVLIVLKSGSLILLEPSEPVQACNGVALPSSSYQILWALLQQDCVVSCTDETDGRVDLPEGVRSFWGSGLLRVKDTCKWNNLWDPEYYVSTIIGLFMAVKICVAVSCFNETVPYRFVRADRRFGTKVHSTVRLPWLRFFRAFPSAVRRMPGYNWQRQGTASTLPKLIVLFCLLFVCKCVLYCCHWVATQL
jgi:hypothetical protein